MNKKMNTMAVKVHVTATFKMPLLNHLNSILIYVYADLSNPIAPHKPNTDTRY